MAVFSYTDESELVADIIAGTDVFSPNGQVKSFELSTADKATNSYLRLNLQRYSGVFVFKKYPRYFDLSRDEFLTLEFRYNLDALNVYVLIDMTGDVAAFDALEAAAELNPGGTEDLEIQALKARAVLMTQQGYCFRWVTGGD